MAKLILEKAIKKRKVSKRQLAIRMNKPYFSVFRYFRDNYNPTLETLIAIAKALKCKVRDLIQE